MLYLISFRYVTISKCYSFKRFVEHQPGRSAIFGNLFFFFFFYIFTSLYLCLTGVIIVLVYLFWSAGTTLMQCINIIITHRIMMMTNISDGMQRNNNFICQRQRTIWICSSFGQMDFISLYPHFNWYFHLLLQFTHQPIWFKPKKKMVCNSYPAHVHLAIINLLFYRIWCSKTMQRINFV